MEPLTNTEKKEKKDIDSKISRFIFNSAPKDEVQYPICPECDGMLCVHRPTCLTCGYK